MADEKAWNCQDLTPLFDLEQLDAMCFRSDLFDNNMQQRVYGGQLLAQAAAAAARCVPPERLPTYLHGLFLRGAVEGQPVDYRVDILQQGKRFTSCHVSGTQGDTRVIDCHVSFQAAEESGFRHEAEPLTGLPALEDCPDVDQLQKIHEDRLNALNYTLTAKATAELRLINPENFLFQPNPTNSVSYWVRPRQKLPDDPLTQMLATIYLSDYFAAYCVVSAHKPMAGARDTIYMASLNHSVWLHAQPSPNDGLLFVTSSPYAISGRGLANGHIYNRNGRLIASLSQECSATSMIR